MIKSAIALSILLAIIIGLVFVIKSEYWRPLLNRLDSALSEYNNKWSITRIAFFLQTLVVVLIVYILFGVIAVIDGLPNISAEHVYLLLGLAGISGATKVMNKKFEKEG